MPERPAAEFPFFHPATQAPAMWHPTAPRTEWVAVDFRTTVRIDPEELTAELYLSASQRLVLTVNSQEIVRGPSRSDPDRWGVITLPVEHVGSGEVEIEVRVWHAGPVSGVAQMGPPAFLLVGSDSDTLGHKLAPENWHCVLREGIKPQVRQKWAGQAPYDVLGAGDYIQCTDLDASDWLPAKMVAPHAANTWGNLPIGARLRPEPLPNLLLDPHEWTVDFPIVLSLDSPRIVLDAQILRNAYLALEIEGVAGGELRIVSCEAPSEEGDWRNKRARDDSAGAEFCGHVDVIRPDGRRRLLPLNRLLSYRYVDLQWSGEVSITLHAVHARQSGFPFGEDNHAQFAGPRPVDMARMQEVADRTIERCAHDQIFDCPHYEQCQFPGDSRLQALYHYLIFDEDRLGFKAIDDFHASRASDGMIECRWPSTRRQILPTFGLAWVLMMDDARMWRGAEHLQTKLHGARELLEWFTGRIRPDGLLGHIPYAPFVDWSPGFDRGLAPQDDDGGSAWITATLSQACGAMARLERSMGYPQLGQVWDQRSADLYAALENCWCSERNLYADTPSKRSFSLHSQLAVLLCERLESDQAASLLRRSLAAEDLIQPGSYYYRTFLFEAARVARCPDVLLNSLHLWTDSIDTLKVSTFPETSGGAPRSDCHGWSAMPEVCMVTGILGLRPHPTSDACARLIFDPQLDTLTEAAGALPTTAGRASASVTRKGGELLVTIDSPVPVFVPQLDAWLEAGHHDFTL